MSYAYDQAWTTVVGTFADSTGIVQWDSYDTERAISPGGREHVAVTKRTRLAHQPASCYSATQPWYIPILWRHGEALGRTVLLTRRSGNLSAVGVLPLPVEQFEGVELFFSSGTSGDDELVVHELSLVDDPATNGLPAVRFFPGLPAEAKGRHGAPWATLDAADDVIRFHRGNVDAVECRFIDREPPRRRPDLSRAPFTRGAPSTAPDNRAHEGPCIDPNTGEVLEMIFMPAKIVAVNGRPVGG